MPASTACIINLSLVWPLQWRKDTVCVKPFQFHKTGVSFHMSFSYLDITTVGVYLSRARRTDAAWACALSPSPVSAGAGFYLILRVSTMDPCCSDLRAKRRLVRLVVRGLGIVLVCLLAWDRPAHGHLERARAHARGGTCTHARRGAPVKSSQVKSSQVYTLTTETKRLVKVYTCTVDKL